MQLRAFYPEAPIVACSTAGEIDAVNVVDDSITCTSLRFNQSRVTIAKVDLQEHADSEALGGLLISRLPLQELVHVLVLSDGLKVNGSSLLKGMLARLPPGVGVTGGLAADGPRFSSTAVCIDGPLPKSQIAAIGLYGAGLCIRSGSHGGWDAFGIERTITKARDNVLYELDGEPALDLYKRYLGAKAAELPASGLRFPLAIRPPDAATDQAVVRTILSVDELCRTLTFAGDVPAGYRARLMSANLERLIDGARNAALQTRLPDSREPELAILISCVGRKLVLQQRIEEEVEAVQEVLGNATAMTGFYSYGELSPCSESTPTELHNQTMTITTISEH